MNISKETGGCRRVESAATASIAFCGVDGRQALVLAIAMGGFVGLLASTHLHILVFVRSEHNRAKAGSLVSTVAERLIVGQTTSAVCVILSGFEMDLDRATSGNSGKFRHNDGPMCVRSLC